MNKDEIYLVVPNMLEGDTLARLTANGARALATMLNLAAMEAENGGSAKGRILKQRTPVLGKKRIRNEQPL